MWNGECVGNGTSAVEDGLDSYCVCGDFISSKKESLKQHMATFAHRQNYIEHPERVFKHRVRLGKSVFKNLISEYIIDLNQSAAQSPLEVLEECKETIKELYNFELVTNDEIKVQLRLCAVYQNALNLRKLQENDEDELHNIVDYREVQSKSSIYIREGDFEKFFDDQTKSTVEKFENMEMKGSGWTFESFSDLTICIAEHNAVRGSSHIKTPKEIRGRRSTLNIENFRDQM